MVPAYTCGQCGLGVLVVPGREPVKACFCDAPIVANLQANLAGVGGLK